VPGVDVGLVFSALADPTRREVVRSLAERPGLTASHLAGELPITRQAVTKHLGVLDRAGLVHATPMGRERRYEVDEAQLSRAVRQLNEVGRTWDARLNRIKRIAEHIQRQRTTEEGDR